MTEPEPAPEILSETDAKQRLLIYTIIRLTGIGSLFGGVLLGRGGITVPSVLLLVFGAASLFIRPRMLAVVFKRLR